MKQVTLSRKELATIYRKLESCVGKLKGKELTYRVARNRLQVLKPIWESLQEASSPSSEYKKMERELRRSAEKHCSSPKQLPNGGVLYPPDDPAAAKKEADAIRKKYSDAIEQRERESQELQEMENQEETVMLHPVPYELVPDDVTGEQMEALLIMLDEPAKTAPKRRKKKGSRK